MQVGKAPIGLRYYSPTPALRGVISSYYLFHADLPFCADSMRADLPQLRFIIKGKAWYDLPDHGITPAPDVNLLGPTYTSTNFQGLGPLLVLGAGILPAGWAAMVNEDASQYTRSVIDAVDIFGGVLADGLDAMRHHTSSNAIISIADRVFQTLFSRAQEPPVWFTRLTEHWLSGELSPEVDKLIAASGMSGRQVERLTKRIYGAPPKLLARKYRALKAASTLAAQGTSWKDVAEDAFFDQSHFIREFKQFIGVTPTQLIHSPSPLTRLTFQRRKLVDTLPDLLLRT